MIEILKLHELTDKQINYLNQVNPWWEKRINKLVEKNKIFMTKFSITPTDHIQFEDIAEVGYKSAFKQINNYMNFFKPKLKQIVSDKKLFTKFEKQIRNYIELLGICNGIQILVTYLEFMDNNMGTIPRQEIIRITNEELILKWERYKKEIKHIFIEQSVVDELLSYDKNLDLQKHIFNSKDIVKAISKHAGSQLKVKKITDHQFLSIIYFSYVQQTYNDTINGLINHFMLNLR